MRIRIVTLSCLIIFLVSVNATAQLTPWFQWTFLPTVQMDEIIGESSGETAWNTIMETGGYNKDRLADEYRGTFYETQYIIDQLKLYGLPGAKVERFPGGRVWDGVKGELWEMKPKRQKLASYRDMTAMLAKGSTSADVKAELLWVGHGSESEIASLEVDGKIVVTEGSISNVHKRACVENGALGVIAISQSRPDFDPLQIPWRGLLSWRQPPSDKTKFGFFLPFRSGIRLKNRLIDGETITVHAQVESEMEPYDLEDVVCHIPGTDPKAGEIILSAHLFEGYTKQGANDNKSGSAAILEVARVLHTLIEEERLPRPKRTIRFLWGPEFSGTGPWVKANKDLMEKTLCNINLDMVGESLALNQAFFCLMRTSYGNAHYLNDVMENYYRFIGVGNRERIHNWRTLNSILAPSGTTDPFYWSIETHFGASDHMVFNDWGVGVPGIMMIAWPDQWYHTSGDRVDKADPTQLKRAVIIAAAGAYTIATADDDMAVKIAGEIVSNGTRRLGHQLVRGMEAINQASAENLAREYQKARILVQTAVANELATLESVKELVKNKKQFSGYISSLKKSIDEIGAAHLKSIDAHLKAAQERLGVQSVDVQWTDLEKEAAGVIPTATSLVRKNGYRGYEKYIDSVSDADKEKYPYSRWSLGNSSELRCLIDGKRSVLDIKNTLDVQFRREADLQSVMNYIKILQLAGLVTM